MASLLRLFLAVCIALSAAAAVPSRPRNACLAPKSIVEASRVAERNPRARTLLRTVHVLEAVLKPVLWGLPFASDLFFKKKDVYSGAHGLLYEWDRIHFGSFWGNHGFDLGIGALFFSLMDTVLKINGVVPKRFRAVLAGLISFTLTFTMEGFQLALGHRGGDFRDFFYYAAGIMAVLGLRLAAIRIREQAGHEEIEQIVHGDVPRSKRPELPNFFAIGPSTYTPGEIRQYVRAFHASA